MKKFLLLTSFAFALFNASAQYDQNLVTVSSLQMGNEELSYVAMSREGGRIKAKYFAAREISTGKTVYQRFLEWSKNKQLIAVSSGTYMSPGCDGTNPKNSPVGLCIDNGVMVNNNLVYSGLDGFAIVYPSGGGGGIGVSNLKTGDLTIQESGKNVTINLRDGYSVSSRFIPWAQSNKATVFQSHLFVFKNQFLLDPNKVVPKLGSRRVLAVGTNLTGQVKHYIINLPNSQNIYSAAQKAFTFLQKREKLNITFMLNLDTGCQDVFQVYKPDGTIESQYRGTTSIYTAANLLCYYYE